MSHIVRRVTEKPTHVVNAADLVPARSHRAGGIFVESQLALGIEPKLFLSWSVMPRYWSKGYSLMVFRSVTGFCPEKFPADLNLHGQLIIETTHDDRYEEHPAEGTYYYTFLLHKRTFFGLGEKMSLVRFSETIPSAKVGIGRISDRVELKELLRRDELGDIQHEAALDEAALRRLQSKRNLDNATNPPPKPSPAVGANTVVTEELGAIDAIVEAVIARRKKMQDLEKDPRFQSLTPTERKKILKMIRERLDEGEMSARRESRTT